METQGVFEVHQSLLAAIWREEAKRDLVQIPAGSDVIVLLESPWRDERFVEVLWNGQACLVFAVDLQNRASRVSSFNSGSC